MESSGLDLAKSFLLNQLDNLPYGGTTQLGLSELPRPLHRVPLFEAEHQVKLLLHDSFLLGASLKLGRDELWGLLLRAVSLLKGSIGRFCLVLKLLTQSRHEPCVLKQSCFGQAVGLDGEGRGLPLEVVRVEDELAPSMVHLLADGLDVLVELKILQVRVDHDLLVAYLLERLDSSPVER